MKRTRLFSTVLWVLLFSMVIVMALSFAGCGAKDKDTPAATQGTEAAQPNEVPDTTAAQPEELVLTGLKNWELSAIAWIDSNGASVTFTGEPNAHEDGQTAQFLVQFNGEEMANQDCTWDGSKYTATVDLEAADGYSYTCILTAADGTMEQIALSSPDNPTFDTLVYMQSSLTAYCNLFVADYELKDEKMNITSGYVQVQLPQISADGSKVAFEGAELVVQLNGETVETLKIDLPQGEGAGSYESALTSVSFKMPEMKDDYQLDLNLVVKLSDGSTITANGGSWFYNNGKLNMVVG